MQKLLYLLVIITAGVTQKRSYNNGEPNGQYNNQNPSSNNYWYHYWYNGNAGDHAGERQSYEWHHSRSSDGNSGKNTHEEKRDLFQTPGWLTQSPGLRIDNNKNNYFANWLNDGSGQQSNRQWFQNIFQNQKDNFQQHQQNNGEWRNDQWQRSNNNFPQIDDPSVQQNSRRNRNFDQNNRGEDFSGPPPNLFSSSEDYSNTNSLPEQSSKPSLQFWIGAPPMQSNQKNRNTRRHSMQNWFRPGLRRNRTDPSIDTTVPHPIEDELGQIDSLVEAQQWCGEGSNMEEDTETSIRIARGYAATEVYPWLVAIYQAAPGKQMQFICGASLITRKHAISAAHCFVSKDSMSYEFIISNNRILKPTEAQSTLRKADRIILHPGYNPLVTPANSDVAIISFERPVDFGKLIKPICLWRGDNSIRTVRDEIGRIVGWGADENLAIADELPLEINMGIIDYQTCILRDHSFVNVVGENSFCTGYRNGSGPCMGDSGSGFMLKQNGRWSLRGVVSLTTQLVGCDINNYVGLTDVAKYHNWISSVLRTR